MNTRSLRFQLLGWYFSLLVVAFAIVGLFTFLAVKQLLLQNLRDLLSRRARQIAHLSSQTNIPLTREWLRSEIGALYAPETPESNGRFVRVTSASAAILYQSGMPADGSFDPANIPLSVTHDEGFRIHHAGSEDVLVRTARARTISGPIVIEVGAAVSPIAISARQVLVSLMIAAPCFIAIAGIGAYFLVGRALRPVVRLTQSAEAISLHNLSDRLPEVQTGDEIETLSQALNRMIARIHDAVETTRRFIADASHELRTPLAVLRGELENVINRNHLSPDARETLASNLEEVERLGKIVEGLFALSRLDCGEAQTELSVFDLSKIAATTAEQMCLLAEDKGIALTCAAETPAFVRGDPARIKQVLVNLLDNAIKFTPEGGRVDLKTLVQYDRAALEVRDTGVGIPKDALPHVFERFFRVDKARSRDLGGAGLGLSIVKSICLAHNAEVSVESEPGCGARFRVSLPLANAADQRRPAH